MRDFGKLRNGVAIAIIFLSMVTVYSVTSTLNIIAEDDPKECNATYFSLENICFNSEKQVFNNFQTTINFEITDVKTNINGFKIKLFGSKGVSPAVIFRTVKTGESVKLTPAFDKELYGDIKKIEVTPILNINHNILYCSMRHGIIIDKGIEAC